MPVWDSLLHVTAQISGRTLLTRTTPSQNKQNTLFPTSCSFQITRAYAQFWWCIVHRASGEYRPLLATHLISVHKCTNGPSIVRMASSTERQQPKTGQVELSPTTVRLYRDTSRRKGERQRGWTLSGSHRRDRVVCRWRRGVECDGLVCTISVRSMMS